MKSKILAVFLLLLSLPFVLPTPAFAQTAWKEGTCVKSYTDAEGNPFQVATIQGLECLVANVLAVVITIIGIAAFIMFLIGAFQWLTAGSNPKGVEGGRNAITFAIIGIVVALLSLIILRFISDFTGIQNNLLRFNTQIDNSNGGSGGGGGGGNLVQ